MSFSVRIEPVAAADFPAAVDAGQLAPGMDSPEHEAELAALKVAAKSIAKAVGFKGGRIGCQMNGHDARGAQPNPNYNDAYVGVSVEHYPA